MRLHQYNLGRWPGVYYTELANSLQLVGILNSLVGLTVLWAVAHDQIASWFPWLSYPIFMGAVFFAVLVVIPLLDYMLLYRTRQEFLNEQGYKHSNPFKTDINSLLCDIAAMKSDMAKMKEKLGVKD